MKVGYARVSSSGQSLDTQIEKLTAFGCEKVFCCFVARIDPVFRLSMIHDPVNQVQVSGSTLVSVSR